MTTSSGSLEQQNQQKRSYLCLAGGGVLLVAAYFIGINDNFPGILSMLTGFFAVVLGFVYRFAKSGKHKPSHQLLYWSPRALGMVVAGFISLFALDVFGKGKGFWETTIALLIHLIPTYVVLIALAISWRWEWVGATLFTALGALYLIKFWGMFVWPTYVLISGPLLLIGVLFLLNWRYRGVLRSNS
jgi:hypothetical protein